VPHSGPRAGTPAAGPLPGGRDPPREAEMATSETATRKGYVGMEVTKRPPFVVLAIDDLMDESGVLQGHPGYTNEDVRPGDKLLRVDGTSVEATTVKHLHELLGGSLHTLVDLAFLRAGGEEYHVRVQRHGLHEHELRKASPKALASPRVSMSPAHATGAAAQNEAAEIGRLQARVRELEMQKTDLEDKLGQSAAEARAAKQECTDVRAQLEAMRSAAAATAQLAPVSSFLSSQSNVLDVLEGKAHSLGINLQRFHVLLRANQLRLSDMAKAQEQLRMDLAKSQNERELLKQDCSSLERDLKVMSPCTTCVVVLPEDPWQLLREAGPDNPEMLNSKSLPNSCAGGQGVGGQAVGGAKRLNLQRKTPGRTSRRACEGDCKGRESGSCGGED